MNVVLSFAGSRGLGRCILFNRMWYKKNSGSWNFPRLYLTAEIVSHYSLALFFDYVLKATF